MPIWMTVSQPYLDEWTYRLDAGWQENPGLSSLQTPGGNTVVH